MGRLQRFRLIDFRNRVALTREALRALQAAPGDFVLFEVEGNTVRIRKVRIEAVS